MNTESTALVVGGTGRTGSRVLEQLLGRGVNTRAIVRSPGKLSAAIAGDPKLTVLEADLLSLSDQELAAQVRGSDAVISCLGHTLTAKGLFGPPRDLVTQAVTRLCRTIQAEKPERPARFVLMSSVSVNRPNGLDDRRGALDKGMLWAIRGLLPPAKDNQRAADFLLRDIGAHDPYVEWVAVRPDTLLDGEVTRYSLGEGLRASLFAPDETNMANVAHFMCELATDPEVWGRWRCELPVIVNAEAAPN